MIRLICMLAASVTALLAASCCCTSDMKPPGLRPLPQFQEIESAHSAPEPRIRATK